MDTGTRDISWAKGRKILELQFTAVPGLDEKTIEPCEAQVAE